MNEFNLASNWVSSVYPAGIDFGNVPEDIEQDVTRAANLEIQFEEAEIEYPCTFSGEYAARDWLVASDTNKLDPFWVYWLTNGAPHCKGPNIYEYLGDFEMFGVAGHGINSYGLGHAIQIKNLTIFQQVGYGGAFNDDQESLIHWAWMMKAYAELIKKVEPLLSLDSEHRWLIEYSDFRNVASLSFRTNEYLFVNDLDVYNKIKAKDHGVKNWNELCDSKSDVFDSGPDGLMIGLEPEISSDPVGLLAFSYLEDLIGLEKEIREGRA